MDTTEAVKVLNRLRHRDRFDWVKFDNGTKVAPDAEGFLFTAEEAIAIAKDLEATEASKATAPVSRQWAGATETEARFHLVEGCNVAIAKRLDADNKTLAHHGREIGEIQGRLAAMDEHMSQRIKEINYLIKNVACIMSQLGDTKTIGPAENYVAKSELADLVGGVLARASIKVLTQE